ncbi:MAG TPA: phage tail tape measure C-terminal domain-containing protein [Candidatus Acidoferrum sp.]|jgi:hypothetical protein|nr:phage tail tape measure C-terminal domain-containing protein [Candidatus Acidoferrum sp.]
MANILGSLLVELKAETASFVSGMTKASYTAKQTSREISESFSSIGELAEKALSPFGELGAAIGAAFARVGSTASAVSGDIGKMSGSLGVMQTAGAGAIAAIGAIEIGAVGLAIHTAESAAKMLALAQASGVSVEALSGFAFVAKQSGVEAESMTLGLEKMNKAVFAAAIAPTGTKNAFTRLGVSVRDAGGQIKSTTAIFTELAQKFEGMADGPVKTALAIQLFGKSGAALIPVLNQGAGGIKNFLDQAQKLGIVLDTQTAEAAHKLEQSINTIEAAVQGASLQLTKAMLPAIQAVADAFVRLAEDAGKPTSAINGITAVFKYMLQIGDFLITELELIGAWIAKTTVAWEVFGAGAAAAARQAFSGDFSGATATWRNTFDQLNAIQAEYLAHGKQNWQDYQTFVTKLFAKPETLAPENRPKSTNVDTSAKSKPDEKLRSILAAIDALKQQTAAELALAAVTGESTAAQHLRAAAGEADQLISRLQRDADKAEGAEREKLLAVINRESAAIRAYTAEKQVAKDSVSLNTELEKESLSFYGQIDALGKMAAAYASGSAAIASAEIDKKLEKDTESVATLTEEYDRLSFTQGVSAEALSQVGAALAAANAKLAEHRDQLQQIEALSIDVDIARETAAFRGQLPALEGLAAAYLHGADAIRAAGVALRVAEFANSHPGASAGEIAAVTELYRNQAKQAEDSAIAQEAAQYDVNTAYSDTIERLGKIRELLVENGRSTILVDAAADDAQTRYLKQWDAAAVKIGSVHDKFQAFFNEAAIQAENTGEKIYAAFSTAFDSLSGKLAQFVITGKGSFLDIGKSLGESILKAGFQQTLGKAAGAIGGIFGIKTGTAAGGHPGDSANNPLYVLPVDSSFNPLGSKAGGGGILGGILGAGKKGQDSSSDSSGGKSIVDSFKGFGSKIESSFKSIFSSIGSVMGSAVKGIGSIFGKIFGGFLAGGGDVTPGKAYVVGEKHPEFFIPRQSGRIAPTLQMSQGRSSRIENHFHIYTKDADSFQKSQSQIAAQYHRMASTALARNGG